MLSALIMPSSAMDVSGSHYRGSAAIQNAVCVEARPWPVRNPGTGGLPLVALVQSDIGYSMVPVVVAVPQAVDTPFADLMQVVQAGFGRTMSSLPGVFGVSRQTLYNWLKGETPKVVYQERIRELAKAASLFQDLGFVSTTQALSRVLMDGKSFLQLVAEGADGKDMAKKLVSLIRRGDDSRAKLTALVGGRRAELTAYDIGAPSLDERV